VRRKLYIVDPSLVDERGHHFQLSSRISLAAIALGWQVEWLTNKAFASRAHCQIKIVPTFSYSMYARFKAGGSDLSIDYEGVLASELGSFLQSQSFREGDMVLVHTLYSDILLALHRVACEHGLPMHCAFHLCSPYTLESMPGAAASASLCAALADLSTQGRASVCLYGETPQLAESLSRATGLSVRALPLPAFDMQRALSKTAKGEIASGELKRKLRIAYLGPARVEKGFHHIPTFINTLLSNRRTEMAYEFFIQSTPQIIGYDPRLTKTLEDLAALTSQYPQLLTLHNAVLSDEQYARVLDWADMLLMLYEPANYATRGSGIAVEAVSSAVAIVTFAGTFPASLVTHGGGVVGRDLEDIVSKLNQVAEDPSKLLLGAERQRKYYHAASSAAQYCRTLISGQTADPQRSAPLPSELLGLPNAHLLLQ